jgi:hypothetical protein
MPYIQFGSNNYSVAYIENEPLIKTSDWYELPEGLEENSHYKLVDGVVQVCTEDELRNAFYAANPHLKDHFNHILSSNIVDFLSNTDWLIQRHSEQISSSLTTSLTDDEYNYIVQYRHYLRELTNQNHDKETFVFQEFTMNDRYNYLSYNNIIKLLNEE